MTGHNTLSIFELIKPTEAGAGHCELVIYPMVEMTWNEIYEIYFSLKYDLFHIFHFTEEIVGNVFHHLWAIFFNGNIRAL